MGQPKKLTITDPVSGRDYTVEWDKPAPPDKWELLELLHQAKEKAHFTNPTIRGKDLGSIAPELELGNKLVEKSKSIERKKIWSYEFRDPHLSAVNRKERAWWNVPAMFADKMKEVAVDQPIAFARSIDPRNMVGSMKDFTSNAKKSAMENIGTATSDMFSIPSLFAEAAFGLAAKAGMRGARAASKAKKYHKTFTVTAPSSGAAKLDDATMQALTTAPQRSKEYQEAVFRLYNALNIPFEAPVEVGKVVRIGKRLTKEEKALLQVERAMEKAATPQPKQLGLDFKGGVATNPQIGKPINTRQYHTRTIKLNESARGNFTDNVLPMLKAFVDQRNTDDMIREYVGRLLGPNKDMPVAEAAKLYEYGVRGGVFSEIQKMLDQDMIERAISGDTTKYLPNYLPHYWENTPEEIQKALGLKRAPTKATAGAGRTAGGRPGFTKQRTFESYDEGMSLGLTPKYKTLGDLLSAHMIQSNHYKAANHLMNFLKTNKLAVKEGTRVGRAGIGSGRYELVEGMPVFRSDKGTIGHYVFEPNVKKYLDNYFKSPDPEYSFFGNWANLSKAIAMGSGIPWTIFNAHGFNIGNRAYQAEGLKGLFHYFDPRTVTHGGAKRQYERVMGDVTNLRDLMDLSRHGLVTNIAEDFRNLGGRKGLEFGEELRASPKRWQRGLGQAEGWLSENVEQPLFGYKLPATKAEFALKFFRDKLAQGVSRSQALDETAQVANHFFGGMNYIRNYDPSKVAKSIRSVGKDGMHNPWLAPFFTGGMTRNQDQAMRMGVLAHDWTGSNLALGKYGAMSMVGKADPIYAKAIARGEGLRMASRGGKIFGGATLEDLEAEKATESTQIPIGETSFGKSRQLKPMGTAMLPISLSDQFLTDLSYGRINPLNKQITNRLNPWARAVATLLMNEDYKGDALWGENRFFKPIPWPEAIWNFTKTATAPLTHPIINNAIDWGLGKQGLEETLGQGFELPFSYRYISAPRGSSGQSFGPSYDWGYQPWGR